MGPPKEPPLFAARPLEAEEPGAGKLKTPPFVSPKVSSEEHKRSDFSAMSPIECVKTVIRSAAEDAAIASALVIHEGDTKAVAESVASALEEVFGTYAADKTPT